MRPSNEQARLVLYEQTHSQGCGRIPATEGFQDAITQNARQQHEGSLFPWNVGLDLSMDFWDPFQHGLFYGSMIYFLSMTLESIYQT